MAASEPTTQLQQNIVHKIDFSYGTLFSETYIVS